MRYLGCSISKITSVLIRPGAVVRVHNGPPSQPQEGIGPLSVSSNAQLVYRDLIAKGRHVQTARHWRSVVLRFEACCGLS
jgi:hypothetical protein